MRARGNTLGRVSEGFSLLEMLVALVILSLSLGALYRGNARHPKHLGGRPVHPRGDAG